VASLVKTRTKGETTVAKERKNARLCVRSIRAAAFCTFLGLGNRLGLHRCVPIRSHRRDITRAADGRSYRLVYVCITRAVHSGGCAARESDATSAAGGRVFFPFHFVFFSLCRNESTVGIPLSLSFRWSVRSLILACTPRASQGRSWEEGGRVDEQTDERRRNASGRAPVRDDARSVRKKSAFRHETRAGFADNCAFQRSAPLSLSLSLSLSLCSGRLHRFSSHGES